MGLYYNMNITKYKERQMEVDINNLSRNYKDYKWDFGEKAPKEDLEYLYKTCKLPMSKVAKILNSSPSNVGRWVSYYGIQKPAPEVKAPKVTDEILNKIDWSKLSRNFIEFPWKRTDKPIYSDFEYLYIELNLSAYDIAQIIGKSRDRVQGILRDLGIRKSKELHQQSREQMNLRRHGTRFANATPEALKKKEQTNIERYGVKSLLSKKEVREEGMLKKYGVKHPLESQELLDKMKETNLKKWGVEYTTQSVEVIEKMKKTNKERYGVDNVFKLKEYQEIAEKAMIERYGVGKYAQKDVKHIEDMNKEFWEKTFYDKSLDAFDIVKCAEYHNISLCNVGVKLKSFNIDMRTKYSSKNEYDIYKYLKEYNIFVKRKDREVLQPLELDLYVPEYNFAIEFDGLAFHSSGKGIKEINKNIPKDYHYRKTKLCNDKNIQLYHIFENEWVDPVKKDIWKSILYNRIGKSQKIYARRTQVVQIDNLEAIDFCNMNHLQGGCNCNVSFALKVKDEIVAVMTFGKPRFNKDYKWELLRYCCKKYTTVIGGASKLLKHFRDRYTGSIISYANLRWSKGNLYEKLGFTYLRKTEPNYFYFKVKHEILPVDMILHSRIKFQKHKLKNKLPIYDENLSEKENMYMNNYRTIYDCGNLVYALQ